MGLLEKFFVFREARFIQRLIASVLVFFELLGALLFGYPLTPRGQKIDLDAWELVWSDEFDGNSLDPQKWRPAGDGMRRGGYWDAENAIVENGYLYLRTDYKPEGRFGPGWYSGAIETRGLFEKAYGYYECRAICPGAAGLWGAFWTFAHGVGSIDGSGADGAEIDIMESPFYAHPKKQMRNSVTHAVHFDGYGEAHQSVLIGAYKAVNPYTEFNTYGLEWNENEYIFYINGVETDRIGGKYVSQVEEWLLLTVEVGGNNAVPGANEAGVVEIGGNGIITANPDDLFPVDMVVDYVRVYDRRD
ncbi:MAG: glycoside hydrolase family 16 protein [Acutalibacteraceae bacterium]|jgi:beta-glucanase (GH16 family)